MILAVALVDELGLCEASIRGRSREHDCAVAVALDIFPPRLSIIRVDD